MATKNAPSNYDPDLDGPLDLDKAIPHRTVLGNVTPIKANVLPRQPRVAKQGSFNAAVADLQVGENASRVSQVNQGMTLAEFERDLKEMKAMIDNNVRPAISNAAKLTGGTYRVETTQAFTTGGRIYLLAIVTRMT